MIEPKFPIKDLPELYDSSVISQANSLIKTPAYARFTWTQSLHQLKKPVITERVEGIINNFEEDRKRFDKMKQMRFVVNDGPTDAEPSMNPSLSKQRPSGHNPVVRKKDLSTNKTNESQSEEDDEIARTRKGQKPNLVAKVSSGLEKLDSILSARTGSTEAVKEQLEDLSKHSKSKRQSLIKQLSENCEKLFESQNLISEKTEEMHKAFLRRVAEVQSMVSPEAGHVQLQIEDRRKPKQMSQSRQKKLPDLKVNPVRDRYLKIREKEKAATQSLKSMQPTKAAGRTLSETSQKAFTRKPQI